MQGKRGKMWKKVTFLLLFCKLVTFLTSPVLCTAKRQHSWILSTQQTMTTANMLLAINVGQHLVPKDSSSKLKHFSHYKVIFTDNSRFHKCHPVFSKMTIASILIKNLVSFTRVIYTEKQFQTLWLLGLNLEGKFRSIYSLKIMPIFFPRSLLLYFLFILMRFEQVI